MIKSFHYQMAKIAGHGLKAVLIFICLIFFSGIVCAQHAEYAAGDSLSGPFTLTKLVDGDTFWVDDGSLKGLKVRLIGVDAPESRARFGNPEEAYGREATEYLHRLLQDSTIYLSFDVDSLDQFGRTLAYAFLPNGTFVNAKLIEDGYAQISTHPPNVKFVDLFILLQAQARENQKGLWKK